jgi:hypothetical protein
MKTFTRVKPQDIGVRSLLQKYRETSEAHLKLHGGSWDVWTQLCHTHSEVSELFEILKGEEHHGKPSSKHLDKHRILGEVWDIVFSAFAAAYALGYKDEEIMQSLDDSLQILHRKWGKGERINL